MIKPTKEDGTQTDLYLLKPKPIILKDMPRWKWIQTDMGLVEYRSIQVDKSIETEVIMKSTVKFKAAVGKISVLK